MEVGKRFEVDEKICIGSNAGKVKLSCLRE